MPKLGDKNQVQQDLTDKNLTFNEITKKVGQLSDKANKYAKNCGGFSAMTIEQELIHDEMVDEWYAMKAKRDAMKNKYGVGVTVFYAE